MVEKVATRFAPSPTGSLHLGNMRTALFNFLYARGVGGRFVLRIEDTDEKRGSREHEQKLLDDLHWLGLEWDEGPGREGEHGPYHQSQRSGTYNRALEQLQKKNLAYPCFCTAEELQQARARLRAAGKPPRYPGTCANLTHEEREVRMREGRQASLRFRIPENRTITFQDLVRGKQTARTKTIGDFVIQRSNGSPAFFFANALDDANMGITHVLRGEDHLANTPRQLLILEALALPVPRYGHVTLVLDANDQPLSKRRGGIDIAGLREQGYLAGAVANYLARLGHHYDIDNFMDHDVLVNGFHIERLGRSAAHFDPSQLAHWQKEAVARLGTREFSEWMGGSVRALVPGDKLDFFIETVQPNCTWPKDAGHWAEALFGPSARYSERAEAAINEAGAEFFAAASQLAWPANGDWFEALKEVTGHKGKALFLPLRAALTGEVHGPELRPVLEILGPEKIAQRLHRAAARS